MKVFIHILLYGKKSLKNIPYRTLLLNCKQHSKIRKQHILIKCVFTTISFILQFTESKRKKTSVYTWKKLFLKVFGSSRRVVFLGKGLLKICMKFTEKTPIIQKQSSGEHFMKYSFRGSSWNMKYFHEYFYFSI